MPTLTYTNSAFVTLTRISSSVMNAFFTDITTFMNTTKLTSTNVQANGLTRDRLAAGTAYAIPANTSSGDLGSGITPGSVGQFLGQSSTAAQWETTTDPLHLRNHGLTSGAPSSGAILLSLVQADGSTAPAASNPVRIAMRSSTLTSGLSNLRSATAATTLTLQSGVTLGHVAQVSKVYVYAVDSDGSGTIKLAASTRWYDERALQTTTVTQITGTCTSASPGVWTCVAHGMSNGDVVRLTNSGGGLPTGFSVATDYYVVNKATDTFQLSTTLGGSGVNTSSTGTGTHYINVADTRLASDAVYTSKPIRLLGVAAYTIATAGTWVAADSISLGAPPSIKQPTIQKFTSGTAQTYTTPCNPAPLYIRVRAVGAGGGASGSGTAGAGNGSAGTASTFGTSLISAGGGSGGTYQGVGGAGGAASLGTGPVGTAIAGRSGNGYTFTSAAVSPASVAGADAPYYGGGGASAILSGSGVGGAGIANTGGGGGGSGTNGAANGYGSASGGSGGFVEALIYNPLSTYTYTVGALGSAGSAGTNGIIGGVGGSGYIEVTEFYQ